MKQRDRQVLVCWMLGASVLAAAEHRSDNFLVSAPRPEIARQVAEQAEVQRRQKAIDWLGQELPRWPTPCTVDVKVTLGGAGGATSFVFDEGRILSQKMAIEGPLDRILDSVLPHEVTHTIFAAKFRRPLPRWADEGGAVLSEDYQELARHDLLVRYLINHGRMIPLSRLFVLTEYPKDVMALYAQGFSIANYLVAQKGRPAFLNFVWDGQESGWANALRRHYNFASVGELENRWIEWLIAGRGTGADPPLLAGRANSPSVVRGQMPEDAAPPSTQESSLAGSWSRPGFNPTVVASSRPNPSALQSVGSIGQPDEPRLIRPGESVGLIRPTPAAGIPIPIAVPKSARSQALIATSGDARGDRRFTIDPQVEPASAPTGSRFRPTADGRTR